MPINPVIFKKASMCPVPDAMLPVIIYTRCPVDQIREYILSEAGNIKYELPFINAFSVEIPAGTARKMASHTKISLIDDDANVTKLSRPGLFKMPGRRQAKNPGGNDLPSYDTSTNILHSAHTAKSSTAVGVAVLDTGVFAHHDLTMPYNKIIGFKDFINKKTDVYDDDGHGTHIAGIIAGNGYACLHGKQERRSIIMGVAPMANIIGVKVLDNKGIGNVSDILAGLQWTLDNIKKYNIKVINISLGMPVESENHGSDPLARGAAAAAARGICVVSAAGNSGPGYKTINSPGISPSVITVGAADTRNADSAQSAVIAEFSSRGPTDQGLAKPDLAAPGVEITSLSGKSPAAYINESGTSMATPMVSGAAALLYEKNPGLSPMQVKRILMHCAVRMKDESKYAQGSGMLNIEKALAMV